MENLSIHKFCSECETRLKRQVIGSNVFYYCRNCGRMISEACLPGGVNMLHVPKPLSAHSVSSTDLQYSEDARKGMVGT